MTPQNSGLSCLVRLLTGPSQKKIAFGQAPEIEEADLAFRIVIGVRVQKDASLGAHNVIADLAWRREPALADEGKGLVPAKDTVGIDPRQI
jgi:hypothetical protein